MTIRSRFRSFIAPTLASCPQVMPWLNKADKYLDLLRHSLARVVPQIIQADPQSIFITLTADCNLRCIGCNYGRTFMSGHVLSWPVVKEVLDDAKTLGIRGVRLYGGEPLLHPDLPRIVEYSVKLGLKTWVTTNGILLKKRIDDLYCAGLRQIDIGIYGVEKHYNAYVQRNNSFAQIEAGIAYTRERYGLNLNLNLGWVLMRPTCNLEAVADIWQFGEQYAAPIGVNLIHYSLPYFNEGPEGELQFNLEDRPEIEEVVAELLRLKSLRPEMITQSVLSLRSIPDWLLKKSEMKVPCDRYRLIWIGADGTVQLCYVTFKLGNLHDKRLAELLFTPQHHRAALDAFNLHCPNCHCGYDIRIEKHAQSRKLYGGEK
ncbi:MAG: radical SAM protein [Nitrospira sp.]|nr:radical SAM protein [Nitrospira sp.]MCA9470074.1 radical SAM protein [Nitrospira sp.]